MADTTPKQAAPLPVASHINECISQALEAIYGRCGPYYEPSTHAAGHAVCLTEMETFCRGVIEYMELVRSQLRLRLSAASRVNQLPADVLIHIFAFMPFDELVTATHVCHQWRKLGLETPALWAHLTLDGPVLKDAGMLLARSKAAPVNVALSPSYHNIVPADTSVRSLGLYMTRLQGLWIRRSPPSMSVDEMNSNLVLALPEVLRLEYLNIEWDIPLRKLHITAPHDAELKRADFSSLKEVVIRCAMGSVDFLRYCTHLRVLTLDIPANMSDTDILLVVEANPLLQHLVLRVARTEINGPRLFDSRRGHKLVHPNLYSLELSESGPTYPGMHASENGIALVSFIFACIDCLGIPSVRLDLALRQSDMALYSDMLSHLQSIAILDIGVYGHVYVHDSRRGFMRGFSLAEPERPRLIELPVLDIHVRALHVTIEDWLLLRDRPQQAVFPSLEELWLCGTVEEDGLLRPAAACPRLRVLTLRLYQRHQRLDLPHEQRLAVGMAVALRRVCYDPMPRLERLAVAPGDPPYWKCTTWRCTPPLPAAIDYFYYDSPASALERPTLLDIGVSVESPWPMFPSIPELRALAK